MGVQLVGHSGPVYGVSIAPDRRFVLSASEDSTGIVFSTRVLFRCILIVCMCVCPCVCM